MGLTYFSGILVCPISASNYHKPNHLCNSNANVSFHVSCRTYRHRLLAGYTGYNWLQAESHTTKSNSTFVIPERKAETSNCPFQREIANSQATAVRERSHIHEMAGWTPVTWKHVHIFPSSDKEARKTRLNFSEITFLPSFYAYRRGRWHKIAVPRGIAEVLFSSLSFLWRTFFSLFLILLGGRQIPALSFIKLLLTLGTLTSSQLSFSVSSILVLCSRRKRIKLGNFKEMKQMRVRAARARGHAHARHQFEHASGAIRSATILSAWLFELFFFSYRHFFQLSFVLRCY